MSERQKVLAEINAERDRQEAKWGRQDHQPERWLSILGEEFGEVCKAVCEASFPGYETTGDWSQYRTELIHVAAVAAAMAECSDRRGEVLAEGRTLRNGVVVNEWSLCKAEDDPIDAHNKKVVAEAREIGKKYEDGSIQGDMKVVCNSPMVLPVRKVMTFKEVIRILDDCYLLDDELFDDEEGEPRTYKILTTRGHRLVRLILLASNATLEE